MSSTQCVESINAAIHKYINSHSSLMGFFNRIQAMLAFELQRAEYRDYLKNLAYNIGSSASSWVFSKFVEYLKSVLTDEIFQIQKAQIDICFEYNAQPMSFEQVSLYDNADAIDNAACIEDHSDKKQIALKFLINILDSSEELPIKDEKLSALASKFNLTYIAATLRSLIQQVEQANSDSLNGPDSDTIQNLFIANSRGRHAKGIKLSTEIHAPSSKTINTKTCSRGPEHLS
ncbi:protein far1-related sequence 5-like [Gigaspora margarita]|uniref:Protein far1-related sequence 5-like n=1 Tax=Gigaspora margarita TaxID=4874 RepID=A0A8H4AB70_GIGMA|nr:protein far1-related sequence 5-like [Gigaspora margarita]